MKRTLSVFLVLVLAGCAPESTDNKAAVDATIAAAPAIAATPIVATTSTLVPTGRPSMVTFDNAESLGLEYVLAILDAGQPIERADLRVARCKSLLKQLDETYVENPKEITNMTVGGRDLLEKEGIKQSLLPMMEAMNTLFIGHKGFKYSEYLGAYITLRNKGQKHDEAISSLKALIKALTEPK